MIEPIHGSVQPDDVVTREVDVVVVGAGQAGISVSFYLSQLGVEHVVLERDRAFSSWRNRWEGFSANTPNWMNTLPILSPDTYPSNDSRAFGSRDDLVEYFELCLDAVHPPIETGIDVTTIRRTSGESWEVDSDDARYQARCVVVCNGAMSSPRLPKASVEVPPEVPQIHSSEYRAPDQIGTKGVLIVGSASSGVQICRLLAESGKFDRLAIATGSVMTLPKRVLGVQIHRFLHTLGVFEIRSRSALGRLLYSGIEQKGDPIMRPTPKDLAREHGVEVYGRFAGSRDAMILFSDGGELPVQDLTIVWCTGFKGEYSFVEVGDSTPIVDSQGIPYHTRGVSDAVAGLYFVGLRYQHTIASHDIYGVAKDAEFIAQQIKQSSQMAVR